MTSTLTDRSNELRRAAYIYKIINAVSRAWAKFITWISRKNAKKYFPQIKLYIIHLMFIIYLSDTQITISHQCFDNYILYTTFYTLYVTTHTHIHIEARFARHKSRGASSPSSNDDDDDSLRITNDPGPNAHL